MAAIYRLKRNPSLPTIIKRKPDRFHHAAMKITKISQALALRLLEPHQWGQLRSGIPPPRALFPLTRAGGFALPQLLNEVVQLIVIDQRSRFGGWEPSPHSLLRLWPVL
jgi:hypothetical protein